VAARSINPPSAFRRLLHQNGETVATPTLLVSRERHRYNDHSSAHRALQRIPHVACPFFMPTERFTDAEWPHPARLPLGDGFKGHCTAPGAPRVPDDDRIRNDCNLGYARRCPHLPAQRHADAIRFSVGCENEAQIVLLCVSELNHAPREHGTREYDLAARAWRSFHPDARVQRMAECYLESHLLRKQNPAPAEQPPTQPSTIEALP
jgi:hypothetical protein